MVSYFVGDKRKQKMFVDFEEAYEEAKGASEDVNNGETNAINMPNKDRVIFTHASEAVAPTGVPLDIAAKEYAAAWELTGGAVLEAAREYNRRKLHNLPSKLVPEAVKEMLEAKSEQVQGEFPVAVAVRDHGRRGRLPPEYERLPPEQEQRAPGARGVLQVRQGARLGDPGP